MNIRIDDFLVSDEADIQSTSAFLHVFDIDETNNLILVNQFSDFGCDEHGLMWVSAGYLNNFRQASPTDLALARENTLLRAEIVKKKKLSAQ